MTRPAGQAAAWVAELRAAGFDAEALPLIDIAAPLDSAPLRAAWHSLTQRRLLIFVSPSAVERFFDAAPVGADWPRQTLVGAPGPGTRRVLEACGVPSASIVEPAADSSQFDSESLWQQLRERDWAGASALVVRGDGGREWLAERLSEAGARVDFVSAYRRAPPHLDSAGRDLLREALTQPARHAWLFSSSQAIDHFAPACSLPADDLRLLLASALALTTHPRIADRAHRAGFGRVVASRPALAEVVACLQSLAAAESPST